MKAIIITILVLSSFLFSEQQYKDKSIQTQASQPQYSDPTTGVEIIFAKDGSTWDKIIANGESELIFGDRKDIRQATRKAILRAKKEISSFFEEKLTSKDTIDEITKTLSNAKKESNKLSINNERKSVETVIAKIVNSSKAILKGIIVLEQNVNQQEKYVSVKVGMSRKTIQTADKMSSLTQKNLETPKNTNHEHIAQQKNNTQNEIRRSRNYNDF